MVAEIENSKAPSLARIRRDSVDFPAPEGEERMNSSPRRAFAPRRAWATGPSGARAPLVSVMSAVPVMVASRGLP